MFTTTHKYSSIQLHWVILNGMDGLKGIMYISVYTKAGFYLCVLLCIIIKVHNWLECYVHEKVPCCIGLCLQETAIAVNCLGVAPQRHLQQSKAAYTCLPLHVEKPLSPLCQAQRRHCMLYKSKMRVMAFVENT